MSEVEKRGLELKGGITLEKNINQEQRPKRQMSYVAP
jgi:hypothetical protein